jgi:hypothetical protein
MTAGREAQTSQETADLISPVTHNCFGESPDYSANGGAFMIERP